MFKHHRLRRSAAGLAAVAAASIGVVALGAGPAHAATLPADLAMFANCPVQNPSVTACFYIETTSTSLTAGTFPEMTTTDPMILQFGTVPNLVTGTTTTIAPANGAPVLQAPTIEVPGGLLHLPWAVDDGPLSAYITPTIVGLPQLNLPNLNGATGGPLMTIDLKAQVHNPFTDVLSGLGDGCFIGSDSSPIELNLTTGTTNPPSPNQPISGTPGTFNYTNILDGVLEIDGQTVVDNSWGLPPASGCGAIPYLGDSLDWIVDLDDGQASSGPGHNTAVLHTTIYQANAAKVRAALKKAGDQVVDGGFEDSGNGPWTCAGYCGVDHGLGNQHTGTSNGWVRYISGWNDIHQDVSVMPNTDYTLTGWVRTSANNTDGYFGVRDMQTNVISEQKFGDIPGYTELTVNFNSGDRTVVELYGGVWALGSDTWAQFDDFSITAT